MEAMLTDRRAMRVNLVEQVVTAYGSADPDKMWALGYLAQLSGATAFPHYRALVADRKRPPAARLETAMLASRHVTREQLVDLYGIIAKDPSVPEEHRFTAAHKTFVVDRVAGTGLMGLLARDRGVGAENRMVAAAKAGKAVEREVYPQIARDAGQPRGLRLDAARRAGRLGDRALLRDLAGGSDLDFQARLSLIGGLPRADRTSLLSKIADDPGEAPADRLAAAQELVLLDPGRGRARLLGMAADDGLPPDVQHQARAAAEGLG
jgi:hypothetical protein